MDLELSLVTDESDVGEESCIQEADHGRSVVEWSRGGHSIRCDLHSHIQRTTGGHAWFLAINTVCVGRSLRCSIRIDAKMLMVCVEAEGVSSTGTEWRESNVLIRAKDFHTHW